MAAAGASPVLKGADLVPGQCYESSADVNGIYISGVCVQGGALATKWQLGFFGGSNESFTFKKIECNKLKDIKAAILRDLRYQFDYPTERNGITGHITFAQAIAAGLSKEDIIRYFEAIPPKDFHKIVETAPGSYVETYGVMTPDECKTYLAAFLAPLDALAGGQRRKSRRRNNRKQKQRRATRK